MERERNSGDAQGPAKPRVAAALDYQDRPNAVPRVVAVGKGLFAARIEEVARSSGVPVYRDPQLAWTLAGLGLDREIPAELYQAVAQVIAWVYYLEDRQPPGGDERQKAGTGE